MKKNILIILSIIFYRIIYSQNDKAELLQDSLFVNILNLALEKEKSANFIDAIELYNKALIHDSTSGTVYMHRAMCKQSLNDFEGADKDYFHAINCGLSLQDSYETYYNRGIIKILNGDLDKALSDLDVAIQLNPEYSDAYYNRSIIKGKFGDYEGELADINKVISLRPKDDNAWNSRGIVKSVMGDLFGAINDYSESIKLNGKNADAFFNRGIVHYELMKFNESVTDFNQAIELKPDAESFNRRGNAKHKLNNNKGAYEDYSIAIKTDPVSFVGYINRGIILIEMKQFESALIDLEVSTMLNPDYADNYFYMGVAKEETKSLDESLENFSMAIFLNPSFAEAWYRRGIIQKKKGSRDKACKDFYQALEFGYEPSAIEIGKQCK